MSNIDLLDTIKNLINDKKIKEIDLQILQNQLINCLIIGGNINYKMMEKDSIILEKTEKIETFEKCFQEMNNVIKNMTDVVANLNMQIDSQKTLEKTLRYELQRQKYLNDEQREEISSLQEQNDDKQALRALKYELQRQKYLNDEQQEEIEAQKEEIFSLQREKFQSLGYNYRM